MLLSLSNISIQTEQTKWFSIDEGNCAKSETDLLFNTIVYVNISFQQFFLVIDKKPMNYTNWILRLVFPKKKWAFYYFFQTNLQLIL